VPSTHLPFSKCWKLLAVMRFDSWLLWLLYNLKIPVSLLLVWLIWCACVLHSNWGRVRDILFSLSKGDKRWSRSDGPRQQRHGWLLFLPRCGDTCWVNTCFYFGWRRVPLQQGNFATFGCLWSSSRTFVSRHFHGYPEPTPPKNKDGQRFISVPVSANICSAVRLPTPGIVSSRSRSSSKGCMRLLISSSSF